jgi:uncharacterized membrane protein
MTLLIVGVLLWSAVHLLPIVARGLRQQLVSRLGAGAYKGLFTLSILVALGLMVWGWQVAPATWIYGQSDWGKRLSELLMFFALLLFTASVARSNIRRLFRHSQLTGVCLWAVAHLFANGKLPALVLFGGIGIWAAISIILLNRRDEIWEKPAPVSYVRDFVTLIISAMLYYLIVLAHPYLFGMSLMP